ncbi:methionyl-tRNA formyltransferase [Buchnera aphidicola]|uniref:methionyl-tRNA formyltransferase n=1 Tax=Buchnera aphidicola TaxID=9 RepID=UPI0034645026
MKKIKIIFAGTNKFSAIHLNELILKKFNILYVLTKPDKKFGRGKKKKYSEVKKVTLKNNLPILQPKSLHSKKIYNLLFTKKPDMMIVVSYGFIIPKNIINLFSLGCINIHTSLLPHFRGPSPIQSAILSGVKKTGITIIQINDKIDSGDILYKKSLKIKTQDTYKSLKKKLSQMGKNLLIKFLKIFLNKKIKKIKQIESQATYTKIINKKDGLINWNTNAIKIERKIRAFNPWPSSYFFIKKNIIKVWQAKVIQSTIQDIPGKIIQYNKKGIFVCTKKNLIQLIELQFPGKKKNKIKNIINSYKDLFKVGKILN